MTVDDVSAILSDPQWFFALFIVMWFVVTGLLAHIGGWATLASEFRVADAIDGERFRFVSGSMGRKYFPVGYGGCLFVTVNAQGLHLSILFPFRFLSPPIFVPWSRFESLEERRILFLSYCVLQVRGHWPRITLRGAAGREARRSFDAAGGRGKAH